MHIAAVGMSRMMGMRVGWRGRRQRGRAGDMQGITWWMKRVTVVDVWTAIWTAVVAVVWLGGAWVYFDYFIVKG